MPTVKLKRTLYVNSTGSQMNARRSGFKACRRHFVIPYAMKKSTEFNLASTDFAQNIKIHQIRCKQNFFFEFHSNKLSLKYLPLAGSMKVSFIEGSMLS